MPVIETKQQINEADAYYSNQYQELMAQHAEKKFYINSYVDPDKFSYIKVLSLVKKTDENAAASVREQMQKVFTAMWTIQKWFNMIIRFDGSTVQIFVGTYNESRGDLAVLRSVLESAVSGIAFEQRSTHDPELNVYEFKQIFDKRYCHMGLFAGNPVVREYQEHVTAFSPLDEVLAGSSNIPWIFCISASPVAENSVQKKLEHWMAEATECSECTSATYNLSGVGTNIAMNTTQTFSGAESYHRLAQAFCAVHEEAMQCGQWCVTATCYSDSKVHVDLFGGMFSAQLKSGREEMKRPLPLRYYSLGQKSVQPSFQGGSESACTYLSSRELAAICALPVKDTFGFQVMDRADFDVHRSVHGNLLIGNILNGQRITEAEYSLDLTTLNRHGLIIGLTGGGKTNTVKSLLYSVACQNLPFLVIEPAKKEYYELFRMGMTDLQVYSVGSLEGNVLKINPFELMKTANGRSVSLQSHIDAVFAAFKASFIMYTPMPYVLETAIYEIYRDYGWDVETGENRYNRWEFPTIEDLYYKIAPVVKQMGYDDKMQEDLIGSLKARIHSLRVGSKGRTLNVARSIPMEKLLEGRVVIELDDVGDEDAKAFIISLLLMQLQECRKVQDTTQLGLRHLLLIEEAHRLLKNISSGSGENADPRGAAVEYFCNMLAELRSKGQGFLVIDQIPSKLAPDLVKNTNLKIIHRTVAEEDRNLVGGAMHMDENQKEYLSCLGQGVAAVYSEGDNRPKLVKLPYAGAYEKDVQLSALNREEIIALSGRNCQKQSDDEHYSNQMHGNPVCRHCRNSQCSRNWTNPEQTARTRMPAQMQQQVLDEVYSRSLADALIWLYDELAALVALPERESRELENCLMAAWFGHFQEHMDYELYAKLSEDIIDMIYIRE